ncbi:hypothetical protein B0H15DRAFT_361375 [Mycena belliarum]|uniref:Myb-like domain-containing protein n=1 Tax=Mycena belliarum TaxID=1033014 RepID=A0AAD6U6H2_9AGAR|nr:hypothetical protein B0H15DRAFT_361375 [Mycena belliae]
MDNPQHYQPLSYALHPPNTSTTPKPGPASVPHRQEEQEEEEEEDENVADHLNSGDASASKPAGTGDARQFLPETDPGGKRRPGRPRGSKTRKNPSPAGANSTAPHSTGTSTVPPQLPDLNSQNQQYYEFQWRVLNLCAEFYGAAEELVKGTPPLVVAQCYQMGPGSKVDPLVMLNDAKRICDTLLANPTQLISTPPPPLYPVIPTFYHPQPAASTSTPAKVATSSTKPPSSAPAPTPTPAPVPLPAPALAPPPTNVITNPGSFVVSLGTQPTYQYANYPPPPAPYAGPYYTPYGYPPGPYYHPPGPAHMQTQQPQPTVKPPPPTPLASTSTPKPASAAAAAPSNVNSGNQGPWSDDELERLNKLAADSKAASASGETDWDWVVGEWGPGRTRHQILLKATGLGMKESKGRNNKRRREADEPGTPASPAPPPNPAAANANAKIAMSTSTPSNTGSPATSHVTATPVPSPSMSHLQRPSSAKGPAPQAKPAPAPTSALPWPMPTVAAADISPVLATAVQGEARTSSYYRPRPPADAGGSVARPATTHQFMYQNGPVQNSSS